jgi:voltage-gated potassium channel
MFSTNEQDIVFYKGDTLSDASLEAVHIKKAKYLICALPNDADNLFVVLSARQLNPKLVIVSRVSEEVNQSKLELAGAYHIIQPDKIGGDYMAAFLTVPNWIHFLGKSYWWGDEDIPNIEEISLDALPQRFQNNTLSEMSFFKTAGCNVIGYRDKHSKQLVNPDASLSLSTKGTLIVLGTIESLKKN